MKNLLFFTLIFYVPLNVFCSFPVHENFSNYNNYFSNNLINDTTKNKSKSIDEYHLRMQQQGFDISECMCEDCRKFKGIDKVSTRKKSNPLVNFGIGILIGVGVVALIIGIILFISLYRWSYSYN